MQNMYACRKNLAGVAVPLCAAMLFSSCARIGRLAERRADRAAYGNIRGAQVAGLGREVDFSIGNGEDALVHRLLELEDPSEDPTLLTLSDSLAIAMSNSRSYKTRKENLFLQALSLTQTQKDFNWNYSASADARTSYTTLKNGQAETFGDNGIDSGLGAAMTRTLASGAKVTLNYSQSIVNSFTDPDASDFNNSLSFGVVQPLLNGFGPLVAMEPLRQAERDMVYAVRDFQRYQQEFVIDIASQYYATLRSRDQLINERKNYESAVANREQTESYAKAGRIADFQAAQARQSELNAADRWTLAQSDYQRALDDFRFTLGLPIDLSIEPDPVELEALAGRGLVDVDITIEEALASAVSNRLDLVNERQRVEDRARKLKIKERNFLPNLDARYGVEKGLETSGDTDVRQDLSVTLELPLDWTEKRNEFRRAQIDLDRERRTLEEDESDVQRGVRDLWRRLSRNRSIYNNRLLSVQLAERRVENTQLLLKQGKALTRDLLDAQEDLLSSRNEATVALVDYTINRLRFWNAIERFEIDPKGMWYEQLEGTTQAPVGTP